MKATWLVALLAVCLAHRASATLPCSCADVLAQGSGESREYEIDAGNGPLTVYCDMAGGQAYTIIHHDHEFKNREDRKVDNCEDPGSFVAEIKYQADLDKVSALIDKSDYCEQFVGYTSHASVLKWIPENQDYGWWVNRHHKKMSNWGGSPAGANGCGCSVNSKGCRENKLCNADCNIHQEIEDSGFLKDKETLPVTELRFGDTGNFDDDEYGFYELGPIRCRGGPTKVEPEIPIFDTNTNYHYRYNLPKLEPGECRVEFAAAACNDVFLGFSTEEGEQSNLIELNMGGWGNSKTVWRSCRQCTAGASWRENSVITCDEMQGFWVDWCDGCFHLGRQGAGQSLSWCPPQVNDWRYVAYTTGYGSNGKFRFDSSYSRVMHSCEHEMANLNCGTRFINIIDARFGRSNRDVCVHEHIKSTQCLSAKSMSVVGKLCHGQHSCRVTVTSGVFGDPCPGTHKYLKVKYQCLDEPQDKYFTPDACVENKCNPRGGECLPVRGIEYQCSCRTGFSGEFCENEYAVCQAWGDPHYTQFSRRNFNYQGKCKYILAEPCNKGDKHFKVVGVNVEPSWNDRVSYNRQLEVQIGKTEIFLQQNKQVLIDNNINNVPCSTGDDIVIGNDGKFVVVSSASYGIKIMWDGKEVYKILVDRDMYGENMCGLCGSIKPHTEGIFIMRSGSETTDINAFGDSWTANPLTCSGCKNCVDLDHCDENANLKKMVFESCEALRDPNGVFSVGHKQFNKDQMFETCVFDMCSRENFDDKIRCNNLEEYANRILSENRGEYLRDENAIINWREKLNCPYKCPKGSMYSICTSSCQRTCYQPMVPAICKMSCVEGCELFSSFVMENGEPVAEDQCGCRYENKYFKKGDEWINHDCSVHCVCEGAGQASCLQISCADHAFCGSLNMVHGCHCEPNYIGNGCSRCQLPCPSNMGNEDKIRAHVDEGGHAIIDLSRPIACEGYIKYFTIKRHTNFMEPVTLIIWRRKSEGGNEFVIVGSARLTIADDSLDLCSCDNSKIPVHAGDYIGFMSSRGTVYYDDESDPAAGEVYAAPYFDSVEPMTEVEFLPVPGLRAYSINIVLESSDGKHVEPFMFNSYLGVQSGRIPDIAMSASSSSGNYEAHRGRLDNTEFGACSWTAESTNKEQWLQVELAQEMVVIGVVSQGHCGIVDKDGSPMGCVKQFNVQYSSNGENFVDVTDEHGQPEVFESRCNCQKHVKNFFIDALWTRFIRFRPVAWKRAISMRVDLIGRDVTVEDTTDDDNAPPGKLLDDVNAAIVFTGKPFKRGGFLRGLRYRPLSKESFTVAVLRGTSSVDTFTLVGSMYVTSSGDDKVQVYEVREEGEQIPVRVGDFLCLMFEKAAIGYDDADNSKNAVMTTSLGPAKFKTIALAGKITFTSSAKRVYRGLKPLLRVATTKTIPPVMSTCYLGIGEGQVKDKQITASSFCDSNSKAVRARLGLKDQQGMTGGWCGRELDQTAFIQVDFLKVRLCSGVVTQGLSSTTRLWFVQKYIVKCSVDMQSWKDVADDDGNTMMFSGNYDQESEVQNSFRSILNCRALRIIPVLWEGVFPAMRFDVLGLPDVISTLPEIGFAIIKRESTGSGGYTFVMPEKQFEEDGFVTGIRFLPCRRGSFRLIVFRPVDMEAKTYKVVGRRNIRIKKADVEVEIKFRQKKKRKNRKWMSVKKGDMVGFSFTRSVLYKSKEGDDLTPLIYSQNRFIKNYRRLRAGRMVQFLAVAPRSYSVMINFKAKSTDEVVSSVDAQNPLGLENGQFPIDAITVSSTFVSDNQLQDFGPRSCRLKFNGKHDGAWVPAVEDIDPWIQVDTGSESIFTGLITQGRRSLINWWTTKYSVSYSNDGVAWEDVLDCSNNRAVFDGNTDSDTEVTRYFCNAVNGRYLRIFLLEWVDRPALRFEVLGGFETAATEYGPSCISRESIDSKNYILLAAGIPFQSDGYITEWKFYPKSNKPFKAGVWRKDPDDPLRYKHIGSSDIPGQTIDELATYRLDKSNRIPFRKGDVMGWSFTDAVICFDEGEESIELLYSGNAGKLTPTAVGQYRKFESSGKQAYSISASVSISTLESVPSVACEFGLGMEDERISDQSIDSSSVLDGSYGNARTRPNTEATETMKGCWAPATDDEGQYVQVDLGKPTLVTGVNVQGCNGEERWVTKFRVQMSSDLKNWKDAYNKQGKVIFYGNTDSDSAVQIFFREEFKTQFVRIIVEEWNTGIGLRFEVLGCTTVCEEEWGANPLVRRWKYSQCDKTFVVNTENPLTCNSYIKGWRMIAKHQASVTFYVLKPINVDKGMFKVVGKTRVPRSRDRPIEEVFEIMLDRRDWIEVRSGHMIGFASRRSSPIFRDKRAHDRSEHMIARNRRIRGYNRLDIGDKLRMRRFKSKSAMYSFKAILTQEGVGEAKDTLPPISCSGGLGMENGGIPDSAITVSSALDVLKQGGAQARLMGSGAWAAGQGDTAPFIQVVFGYTAKLTGIASQGDPVGENWVTSYTVEYTAACHYITKEPQNFQFVKFTNALSDVFSGNIDQSTVKINYFTEDIEARAIRLAVKDFRNHPVMRLEFLGCTESDPCKPNPCQNGALCRKSQASNGYSCNCPMEWGGKNCEIRTHKCCAYGDPHYCNLDGSKFNFQGGCTYVLTRTKGTSQKDHFEVTANNFINPNRPSVSVTREVFVQIGDKKFDFKRNREVFVNEQRIACPYERDGISVTDGSNGRVILKTEFGLLVSWDGRSKVDIHLTTDYNNEVEGLCGNYNGKEGDDFILRNSGEQTTNINQFGESWGVDPTCKGCVDCEEQDICRDTGRMDEAQEACRVLTDPHGPFAICRDTIDPQIAYTNCMFDFCAAYPGQDNLCEDIQSYADECTDRDIPVGNWRKPGFCAVDCPPNMVMNQIGTLCPNSCGDQDASADCTGRAGPMCECMPGMFLEDGNRCVQDVECGCTYNGIYHKNSEQFMAEDCSEICSCDADHSTDCQEVMCNDHATCGIQNGVRGCYCNGGWAGDGIEVCNEILEPKELVICEFDVLSIDCTATNELIEILEVAYSTIPREECPKTLDNSDQLVKLHEYGKTIIRDRCHNQGHCSFNVDTTVFGSFADDVYKNLYVKYQCRESVAVGICHPDVELIGCTGGNLEIQCGNMKVDVIHAAFGRRQGDHVCPTGNAEVLTEDCFASSALHRMMTACHTNSMCTVEVLPETFGTDTCPDINKYLRIHYRCVLNPDPREIEDNCDPNPCVNGACEAVSIEPKYNCKCEPGYTGKHCDIGKATCKALGDPHYITFDNNEYDFMGSCKYTLVKNADGEVPDFEVVVYNQAAARNPLMSSTVQVEFIYKGQNIHLKYGGETILNGVKIEGKNTDDLQISVNYPDVVIQTNIGVELRWDGKYMIEVDVTGEYFGHTEGLCGTYNDNPADDYLTRFGETLSPDLEDLGPFGRSWFVPGKDDCVDCVDCELPEPCSDAAVKDAAQEICNNLISETGPFRECHEKVSPSFFFKSCVTDRCTMPDGLAHCDDYQAYAELCMYSGIAINWRRTDFCFIDCLAKNMVYNPLSPSCPTTCANPLASSTCNQADKEDCVCAVGMIKEGLTCIEVEKCGCVDEDSGIYYKQGETFMSKDCSKVCSCESANDPQCYVVTCPTNEVCGTVAKAPACVCADGYFRDTELNTCEAIPIPQIIVRPQYQLECSDIICKGGFIDILEANFGPQLDEVCLEAGDPASCNVAESLDILRHLCQGGSLCRLNTVTMQSFGEPCYNALNYIYTKFACTHKPIVHPMEFTAYSLRVCQGRSLFLACGFGETVDIRTVFFGRRANDAYCLDESSVVPSEGYSDDTAETTALQICGTARTCHLKANSFGDPWQETKEYLEVGYNCLPK